MFHRGTLAFALLWALPAATQINPDRCRQIRAEDVATLLTLNQADVQATHADNSDRCDFEVKTPVDITGSQLQLTVRQFASHAEAVAYMKNEFPFYFDKHDPLVKTTGPDDHVDTVLTNRVSGTAEAVHDAYMSRIDISGIEPGARAHPTWEYRLQRLALQAAGATVLPSVGLAPDPVSPKRVATPTAAGSRSGTGDISPGTLIALAVAAVVVFLLIRRRIFSRRKQG